MTKNSVEKEKMCGNTQNEQQQQQQKAHTNTERKQRIW